MRERYDPPRILAINDVNLSAPTGTTTSVREFYRDHLGLRPVDGDSNGFLRFCGYPRSGPQLVVALTDQPVERFPRRDALIQVGSLPEIADLMSERGVEITWSRGWFHFDRRLTVYDPAGNLVELISSHRL
jgi:catechol 2,3-dioxygenase-like lactoylglutathione lyase family enzyme